MMLRAIIPVLLLIAGLAGSLFQNVPALKLYAALGFEEFTGRIAFVKRL